MTQAYGSNANDETSILMTNENAITLTPTPMPSSNKTKIVKGLVALGCVAATVAVAGVKMAETATARPVETMTLQQSTSNLAAQLAAGVPTAFQSVMSKGFCIDQLETGPESAALLLDRCDERSENQIFRFSQADGLMRPVSDKGMCWTADDETGQLVLNACDATNMMQFMVYDVASTTIRIKGLAKCVEAQRKGPRPALVFVDCDSTMQEQKFLPAPKASRPSNDGNQGSNGLPNGPTNGGNQGSTNQPGKRPTQPPPTQPPPPPRSPETKHFTLGARGSNTQCLDPRTGGRTTLFSCKDATTQQAIRFSGDKITVLMAPREKNGKTCIDASNIATPVQVCGSSSGQVFKFDPKANMFRNPNGNLCITEKPDVKLDVLSWCDQSGKPMM